MKLTMEVLPVNLGGPGVIPVVNRDGILCLIVDPATPQPFVERVISGLVGVFELVHGITVDCPDWNPDEVIPVPATVAEPTQAEPTEAEVDLARRVIHRLGLRR